MIYKQGCHQVELENLWMMLWTLHILLFWYSATKMKDLGAWQGRLYNWLPKLRCHKELSHAFTFPSWHYFPFQEQKENKRGFWAIPPLGCPCFVSQTCVTGQLTAETEQQLVQSQHFKHFWTSTLKCCVGCGTMTGHESPEALLFPVWDKLWSRTGEQKVSGWKWPGTPASRWDGQLCKSLSLC